MLTAPREIPVGDSAETRRLAQRARALDFINQLQALAIECQGAQSRVQHAETSAELVHEAWARGEIDDATRDQALQDSHATALRWEAVASAKASDLLTLCLSSLASADAVLPLSLVLQEGLGLEQLLAHLGTHEQVLALDDHRVVWRWERGAGKPFVEALRERAEFVAYGQRPRGHVPRTVILPAISLGGPRSSLVADSHSTTVEAPR